MAIVTLKSKEEYTKFLSQYKVEVVGNESTICFDEKNEKVFKLFKTDDPSISFRKKEKKIRELTKYKEKFPNVALPEDVVIYRNVCIGYTMKMFKNYTPLSKIQFSSRKGEKDIRSLLKIACNLADLIKKLHGLGIVVGDFHPNQFMVKDDNVYAYDTDTWGFLDRDEDYAVDLVGRPEYIDPKVRDFTKEGVCVKKYSKETDCYSLAVIIFETLVGYNPFGGKYQLVEYDRPLRALNGISIIGNHDFESYGGLKIHNVAWMSERLQKDFVRIFEKGERFNILEALKEQEKDLTYCKKHKFYYSKRYPKCPMCQKMKDPTFIKEFTKINNNTSLLKKYNVFPEKDVRKVINSTTYLDFNGNVVHLKNDGNFEKEKVEANVKRIHYAKSGARVIVERVSKLKSFFMTFFGRIKHVYSRNLSFGQRLKKSISDSDPICKLRVIDEKGGELFSRIILQSTARLRFYEDYMFYMKNESQLIKVELLGSNYKSEVVSQSNKPVQYEANEKGTYCVCKWINEKTIEVFINRVSCGQINAKAVQKICYDAKSNSWCIIVREGKKYKVYIAKENKAIVQRFEHFNLEGLNLNRCICYSSILSVPADRRIIMLESGTTLLDSKVHEKEFEIINDNSIISVKKDKKDGRTYLYCFDDKHSYKLRLDKD